MGVTRTLLIADRQWFLRMTFNQFALKQTSISQSQTVSDEPTSVM